MSQKDNKKTSNISCFVKWVFENKEKDHKMRASFRRALSSVAENQAWPYIARFTSLTNDSSREAFLLIGASICLDSATENGTLGVGQALFKSWISTKADKMLVTNNEKVKANPAEMRLRRLLVCRDSHALCKTLKPILSVIRGKGGEMLDYEKLLAQVINFDFASEKIKSRWAEEYYEAIYTTKQGKE